MRGKQQMARREHSRSGTYVEGFYRNGNWVSGHYRNGTQVSASNKLTERQVAVNVHRIDGFFSPLVFETTCFLGCNCRVFFYRAEDGGCALFDQLGWPWKLHKCWEERQALFKRVVANRLAHYNFNGRVYFKERQRAPKPPKADVISLSGFVDRSRLEKTSLPSCRNAKSAVFHIINFVPEDKIDVYYPVHVPSSVVHDFAFYSMHEISATFKKHRNKWLCILTSYRRLAAGKRTSSSASDLVKIADACAVCGSPLIDGEWGFGTDFACECSICGKKRGSQSTDEFLTYIQACYKQSKRKRPR